MLGYELIFDGAGNLSDWTPKTTVQIAEMEQEKNRQRALVEGATAVLTRTGSNEPPSNSFIIPEITPGVERVRCRSFTSRLKSMDGALLVELTADGTNAVIAGGSLPYLRVVDTTRVPADSVLTPAAPTNRATRYRFLGDWKLQHDSFQCTINSAPNDPLDFSLVPSVGLRHLSGSGCVEFNDKRGKVLLGGTEGQPLTTQELPQGITILLVTNGPVPSTRFGKYAADVGGTIPLSLADGVGVLAANSFEVSEGVGVTQQGRPLLGAPSTNYYSHQLYVSDQVPQKGAISGAYQYEAANAYLVEIISTNETTNPGRIAGQLVEALGIKKVSGVRIGFDTADEMGWSRVGLGTAPSGQLLLRSTTSAKTSPYIWINLRQDYIVAISCKTLSPLSGKYLGRIITGETPKSLLFHSDVGERATISTQFEPMFSGNKP